MNVWKRFAGVLLAMAMVLSMAIGAFAAGETGSITIKPAEHVPLTGKTFHAYRILDATRNGESIAYTVPDSMKAFYEDYFKGDKDKLTAEAGKSFDQTVADRIAAMAGDADVLDAFAEAALAYAKAHNVAAAAGTMNNGNYVISGLPYGYYVVEDTAATKPVSALMLQTPTAEVDMKADQPELDKNIVENDQQVKTNTAAIGDTVSYQLDSAVPDMTGYTKYFYIVHDTMSKGLTFQDDAAITIGSKTLVKDTDFTVTTSTNADGSTAIEIVLKDFIQYKEQTGAPITITYSAVINENAELGNTPGNENTAYLEYSNNPNVTPSGDPDDGDKPAPGDATGVTPDSKTKTYVTGLMLTKVDENGNTLAGAKFELTGTNLNQLITTYTDTFVEDENGTYYKLIDGTYTEEAPSEAQEGEEGYNADKYENDGKRYRLDVVKTVETVPQADKKLELTTDENGVIHFDGLNAGSYTIKETKAPDGFHAIVGEFTFTVAFDGTNWTVSNAEGASIQINTDNAVLYTTVENRSGSQLPSTGGMGTTLFYLAGGLLIVGAGVVLVVKKRTDKS